ncbi:MAG: Mut7-C RNAse domain-containing protein [Gammaproteobacteria bacterium]|nr:Mut7-C RNAse domain-containing protein [Gammaproteobacteria bacterium]
MTKQRDKYFPDPETLVKRFYCDEMLKRLGRWLRAAGFDTLIADNSITDRKMIEKASKEGRCLVTRDHKLTEYRQAKNTVLLLAGNSTEHCATELTQRLNINWLYRPFSRCLLCNTKVVPAEPSDWQKVPPKSRDMAEQLWFCPGCARLYWPGSHTRKMLDRLSAW